MQLTRNHAEGLKRRSHPEHVVADGPRRGGAEAACDAEASLFDTPISGPGDTSHHSCPEIK